MKGKYLVTTDNWFVAPDGESYRAAWGEVEVLQDNILGVKTNARSTNWFLKIGGERGHVIVAGCQVHYAVQCTDEPKSGTIRSVRELKDGRFEAVDNVPVNVYIAE